jgi:hypothetical protein
MARAATADSTSEWVEIGAQVTPIWRAGLIGCSRRPARPRSPKALKQVQTSVASCVRFLALVNWLRVFQSPVQQTWETLSNASNMQLICAAGLHDVVGLRRSTRAKRRPPSSPRQLTWNRPPTRLRTAMRSPTPCGRGPTRRPAQATDEGNNEVRPMQTVSRKKIP